jgi:hypothetical protein
LSHQPDGFPRRQRLGGRDVAEYDAIEVSIRDGQRRQWPTMFEDRGQADRLRRRLVYAARQQGWRLQTAIRRERGRFQVIYQVRRDDGSA